MFLQELLGGLQGSRGQVCWGRGNEAGGHKLVRTGGANGPGWEEGAVQLVSVFCAGAVAQTHAAEGACV